MPSRLLDSRRYRRRLSVSMPDHTADELLSLARGQHHREPTDALGAAGRALLGAIPARCPVVRKPVCYRGDCRHYQPAGGAHPEATAMPQRRRRAKQ